MQAKLSRFIQRCRGRLEIQGRPRHEAEFVRVGACRCRVMATIVFFMNLIDGWLLLSIPDAIAFAWDQATVVIVCKGVVAVILLCILIPSGKINIAHARLWLLVCATTILTATAVVVGATGLDARITVMLGNWTIVVLALVPMKPLQLVAVHAVTIITLAVTTTAAGQAANINPNWPLLWPTSAMGIMGILINLWHRNMFRRQFYTEIVLKRRTAQADRLLDAALTRPVAQQIRETGSFPTGIYEACIIACDIVGFSHLCRTMTHRQVVHELNRFYQWFDACCEAHQIEPLRSEGDSRIAVAGLWPDATGHRVSEIDAVLAMLEFKTRLAPPQGYATEDRDNLDGRMSWSIRIGIHSGPVMMGVMEGARLCLDVWGDTVNSAARLEQSAGPNQIVVSQPVLSGLRALFEFVPLPEVRVKDDVIENAAIVTKVRDVYVHADGSLNEKFHATYESRTLPVVTSGIEKPDDARSGAADSEVGDSIPITRVIKSP